MSQAYKHHTFSESQAVNTAMEDVRRLTRELDIALNGREGAAPQASLCDLVGQTKAFGELARETKRQIEMRSKGRGYLGLKLWEKQLLYLANKALGQATGKKPERHE